MSSSITFVWTQVQLSKHIMAPHTRHFHNSVIPAPWDVARLISFGSTPHFAACLQVKMMKSSILFSSTIPNEFDTGKGGELS